MLASHVREGCLLAVTGPDGPSETWQPNGLSKRNKKERRDIWQTRTLHW